MCVCVCASVVCFVSLSCLSVCISVSLVFVYVLNVCVFACLTYVYIFSHCLPTCMSIYLSTHLCIYLTFPVFFSLVSFPVTSPHPITSKPKQFSFLPPPCPASPDSFASFLPPICPFSLGNHYLPPSLRVPFLPLPYLSLATAHSPPSHPLSSLYSAF